MILQGMQLKGNFSADLCLTYTRILWKQTHKYSSHGQVHIQYNMSFPLMPSSHNAITENCIWNFVSRLNAHDFILPTHNINILLPIYSNFSPILYKNHFNSDSFSSHYFYLLKIKIIKKSTLTANKWHFILALILTNFNNDLHD